MASIAGNTDEEQQLFDSRLNTQYLEFFYEGDMEYAEEMFELFLDHSIAQFQTLRPLIENGKWEAVHRTAHKLKPSFPLVGLTQVEKKMLAIEKIASTEPEKSVLINILLEVESVLNEYIPILQSELNRFRSRTGSGG